MKEKFKRIIMDFIERPLRGVMHRELNIPLDTGKIVSLRGVRRSGKTYKLFDIALSLRKSVGSNRVVYINFEDDRLFPLELSDLDGLIEAYYELFPENREKKVYIMLDEIQSVGNWEKFVRRIYDTLNVSIFVTGSSSKVMSGEIASALRGRTLSYEIFPFSFKEYLLYSKVEINPYSSKSRGYIQKHLNNYIKYGGFAETINAEDPYKRKILSEYSELIVYKDIIERYGIKNSYLLKSLIKYSFSNVATLISVNKLFNDFKSQGLNLSRDTLYDYFTYLEDAYTMFTIPVFCNSLRKQELNPKKIYAVDNGFKFLFSTQVSDDWSKLYENLVFLSIRRKTGEIFYYKKNQEVDFYYLSENKGNLVNVCVSMEDKATEEREINGLLEALDFFSIKKGVIVTAEREQAIRIKNRIIEIIPLWKWLLYNTETI